MLQFAIGIHMFLYLVCHYFTQLNCKSILANDVIFSGLTPLTLAAELGQVEMYNHILLKARTIKWIYRDTSCAEYPLCDIDSIDDEGHVNTKSALHLVVYGKEVSPYV